MNYEFTILWADDEIDLLKPHVLFLESKGYGVETVTNGHDAIEAIENRKFDLIILDENMPGISGLETLQRIKFSQPHVPVIMITKSEEENIMNQAIGSQIADYLIKPVNPMQILLSIKKNLHSSTLVAHQTASDYRQDFMKISQMTDNAQTIDDWYELYNTLVRWELSLASTETQMDEILQQQKNDANRAFTRFVKRNYESWINSDVHPLRSNEVFKTRVFPLLEQGHKVMLIVIDNFRLDQWKTVMPALTELFTIDSDDLYTSILPTATQYSRNAIFSGLMPADIEKMYPHLWVDEDSDLGKNLNEEPLIETLLQRYRKRYKFSYHKISGPAAGQRVANEFAALDYYDFNVLVFNFVDMLSHSRTDSAMMRELAPSDQAYRSLTVSWFKNSYAIEIFKLIAKAGYKVVLTTDHGTIRVDNPIKVFSDKDANTNLRYKVSRSISYNPKQVMEIKKPARFGLTAPTLAATYIFATGNDFFTYPNNYNQYIQYYTGSFQHGGISMEEMLIPLVTLSPK